MNTPNTQGEKVPYVMVSCSMLHPAWRAVFWGLVLVGLGGLGLLSRFVPLQPLGQYVGPAFLILAGGWVLVCCGRH